MAFIDALIQKQIQNLSHELHISYCSKLHTKGCIVAVYAHHKTPISDFSIKMIVHVVSVCTHSYHVIQSVKVDSLKL